MSFYPVFHWGATISQEAVDYNLIHMEIGSNKRSILECIKKTITVWKAGKQTMQDNGEMHSLPVRTLSQVLFYDTLGSPF